MNEIVDIPVTIMAQVVEGIIFTILGLEAKPLTIKIPTKQLESISERSLRYLDEIISAMEKGERLPVPKAGWQMCVYRSLEEVIKVRIEEYLKANGNPVDDRLGKLLAAYFSDTSLTGTFHEYFRYGTLKPSKFGYGWIAQLTHRTIPKMMHKPLNPVGETWLRGYRLSRVANSLGLESSPNGREGQVPLSF
jgi:hypothetical protein